MRKKEYLKNVREVRNRYEERNQHNELPKNLKMD